MDILIKHHIRQSPLPWCQVEMKPLTGGLIVCSIAIVFVLWNRRFIFGGSGVSSSRSLKTANLSTPTSSSSQIKVDPPESEDETTMLLSQLLSLNRAAHVLSRSSILLEKLLKMDKQAACDSLLRDYDLSSVMVLIKHEEGGHEPEGFKKISQVEKEKKKSTDSKAVKDVKEVKADKEVKEVKADKEVKDVKDVKEVKEYSLSKPESSSDHHHSTADPLRIALYCKNLLRPPRIGRVVRMVQSGQQEHVADQYIIELIK